MMFLERKQTNKREKDKVKKTTTTAPSIPSSTSALPMLHDNSPFEIKVKAPGPDTVSSARDGQFRFLSGSNSNTTTTVRTTVFHPKFFSVPVSAHNHAALVP